MAKIAYINSFSLRDTEQNIPFVHNFLFSLFFFIFLRLLL